MSNRPHLHPSDNGSPLATVPNQQIIYCHTCSVLAKRAAEQEDKEFPGVLPAITFEIQIYNNMPVSVPICGMHLAVGKESQLVTG